MALTKVSYSMVDKAPVNVVDFGAVGDGRTDDSASFQAAVDKAIATTGVVFVPAGEYLIDDTVVLDFPGGIKICGTSPNSIGTRSVLLQKDINKPVFEIASINTHLSDLSFTCYAGSKKDANGNAITVVSTTVNSITLSANPWDGSPVIWNLATPFNSTDGTPYSSAILFNVVGGWIASSVTINGNGTVTLNSVKGANGTLNTSIAGTVGGSIEAFISLAMSVDNSVLTNPNAGTLYCSIKENQFYDNLWFNQVVRAFNLSALGSGGGPGVGTGSVGFMNSIVIDQAKNFIYGQGDIAGLQITNCQAYGTNVAFYAPFGGISSSNFSNLQIINGLMFQANLDLYGLTVTGCSFNVLDGYGYSDLLFNNGGIIDRCTLVGNNFGRSTDQVISTVAINATVIASNNIISNNEAGSVNPWLFILGTGANGYITNSYLGNNNFAAQYGSSNNRLGFLSATPSVLGSTFGGEWVGYQTGVPVIGWVPVASFSNSWVNTGGGTPPVSCFKDQNGVVHLRGSLSSGTLNAAMCTLPTGYRPYYTTQRFPAVITGVNGYIDITAAGVVTSVGGASNSWVSLDGISFPTQI